MTLLWTVIYIVIAYAIAWWITVAFLFYLITMPLRYDDSVPRRGKVPVQVLVLGDIGRSPRMQYHALSIIKHGGSVDIIGYRDSPLHPELLKSSRARVYALEPPPDMLRSHSIPFVLSGPLKVLWQVYTLVKALGYETPAAKWLIVQNPPSIPTLLIAYIVTKLRNTRLMVDWHNYGWSILAGTRGRSHPFVTASRRYEEQLGRIASDANLTVTDAMARQLRSPPYSVRSPIVTMHDRPAAIFRPLPSGDKRTEARRAILQRVCPETREAAERILAGTTKLLVSSTSWTPDEDFGLLLDALTQYPSTADPTPILAVITGKGPQKAEYVQRVAALKAQGHLPGIEVTTAWLSLDDYAALLSAADAGVCLHMSSSGVDLPMKVVDMFGAGLPVVAYAGYESFGELVREGVNGCGFETAEELAAILGRLFSAEGRRELERLRAGAEEEGKRRWDDEWDEKVGRILGLVDEVTT